jgi:hypothetical protein
MVFELITLFTAFDNNATALKTDRLTNWLPESMTK